MWTIAKQFEFSASHQLDGLPEGHQCARLHGHNYVVEVELADEGLDGRGFVRDYGELSIVKDFIDEAWDHRHLNDWFLGFAEGSGRPLLNPTAECMAMVVFEMFTDRLPELVAVRVRETPKTVAEYRP